MTKDEALKLALEWAEAHGEIVFSGGGMDSVNKMNSWATAIKEALAQEQDQDGECKYCTDGCPACDARKLLAQRTWVGLTDEDKKQMAKEANYHWEMTAGEYAERIGELTEAKLKEKNT